MECFEIKWTEPCSLDSANESIPSYVQGIYAVCRTDIKSPKQIQYIGKTKDFSKRIKQHRQEWSRGLSPRQMNKLTISFGTIYPIEGNPSDSLEDIRTDIESFLLNALKPDRNSPQTYQRYTGRTALIINTGKLNVINKIMCSNPHLLELLSKKPLIKKRKTSKSSGVHGTLFG